MATIKISKKLNVIMGKLIDEKKFQHNYRLINQVEGFAGSIMDNIAEGFERNGNKQFIRFLYIAKGSCGELRSQLYRALARSYITKEEFETLSNHSMRINSLIQKLIAYLKSIELKVVKYKELSKEIPKV